MDIYTLWCTNSRCIANYYSHLVSRAIHTSAYPHHSITGGLQFRPIAVSCIHMHAHCYAPPENLFSCSCNTVDYRQKYTNRERVAMIVCIRPSIYVIAAHIYSYIIQIHTPMRSAVVKDFHLVVKTGYIPPRQCITLHLCMAVILYCIPYNYH